MVFYATVAFIMFTINLGFPLSNALLDNPDYNAISRLKDSPIPVYVLEGMAPELVWDYGKISERKRENQLASSHSSQPFGVITHHTKEKNKLNFLKKEFNILSVETFDLNPIDSTRRGYKNRLKADYYIVQRKP